jgi:hypothetical protein
MPADTPISAALQYLAVASKQFAINEESKSSSEIASGKVNDEPTVAASSE